MSGMVELGLPAALAAALEALGYSADDVAVREQVPAAARGTNLVLAAPPSACHAIPLLAGLVAGLSHGGRALVLVPDFALGEWAGTLLPLAGHADLQAVASETPARATRALRAGRVTILLTTPGTALALVERSALKADALSRIVLVWPELFESDAALAALMQDLPAESQRVLIPVGPAAGHPLAERYARRALVTGPLAGGDSIIGKPAVRIATAPWSGRAPILARLIESEDPATLSVWCENESGIRAARAALPVGDPSIQITRGDSSQSSLVVAWDLPTPARLARLSQAGTVILLTPPHALPYVTEVTSRQEPVRIRHAADRAREAAARRREAIQEELDRDDLDGALSALLPLFEREEPARIAAAIYRLWSARPVPEAPPTAPLAPRSTVARVWVGMGKKDGVGAADLVGVLTREIGIDAGSIGRIELRELFSLVEVPAEEAEAIARALSGKTIRRRQVVAKVDRGRPSDGSRGPSGPSPRGRPARPRP